MPGGAPKDHLRRSQEDGIRLDDLISPLISYSFPTLEMGNTSENAIRWFLAEKSTLRGGKKYFSKSHPASRKFLYRGQAWNELIAINGGPLYIRNCHKMDFSRKINTQRQEKVFFQGSPYFAEIRLSRSGLERITRDKWGPTVVFQLHTPRRITLCFRRVRQRIAFDPAAIGLRDACSGILSDG